MHLVERRLVGQPPLAGLASTARESSALVVGVGVERLGWLVGLV